MTDHNQPDLLKQFSKGKRAFVGSNLQGIQLHSCNFEGIDLAGSNWNVRVSDMHV
jgi:uncharacterized protein YjbI with pentapeptide repeats